MSDYHKSSGSASLADLPDELLLHVFTHLSDLGPCYESQDDVWLIEHAPYRMAERNDPPHPGLRAYPFLGQVCRRWERLIQTPVAQAKLWRQLCIDFGHELVTAIHTPLKWSNRRPSADEFSTALTTTYLSVAKMLQFVRQHRHTLTSVTLCNSEGFWGEEGDYLTLNNKHNFQASHLGYMLGLLGDRLQEIRLYNCNDLMNSDVGMWAAVATCPQLRVLVVEGVNCRIPTAAAAHLSTLTNLEELTITGEEHMGQWITGMDTLPASWASLKPLTSLTLRSHQLLETLPEWLADLPNLTRLDLSNNAKVSLTALTSLTRLNHLALQHMDLSQQPGPGEVVSTLARRMLPDLSPLTGLQSLSLAHNRLTRLPNFLSKLTKLWALDVSGNRELAVPSPINTVIAALPALAIVDFRGAHAQPNGFWGEEKCATMRHLAQAAKAMKRRKFTTRCMIDTQ